jgi:hypothetical protein
MNSLARHQRENVMFSCSLGVAIRDRRATPVVQRCSMNLNLRDGNESGRPERSMDDLEHSAVAGS